jgi:hypothetical protein
VIVRHHPARHPFVDNVWSPQPVPSAPVWDVDGLVRDGVDVVHVHFGFEQHDPAVLDDWAARLAAAGIALVHTVHDLDNPHLREQAPHLDRVGVLVRRSAAVTTLTPAAARAIRDRWQAAATVVPHPHVVPLDELRRRRPVVARRGVYVHVATGRPNLDVDAVAALAASGRGAPLRVHARPDAPRPILERLTGLAAAGRVALDVRPRLTDAELWDRMAGAELLLLPYRWGTHSGLLEAAHDLGTPVLAPSFGGYGDQGAHVYEGDPSAAVDAAIAGRPRVDVAAREAARRAMVRAYRDVYVRAVA